MNAAVQPGVDHLSTWCGQQQQGQSYACSLVHSELSWWGLTSSPFACRTYVVRCSHYSGSGHSYQPGMCA
jgi:hypothetical protein